MSLAHGRWGWGREFLNGAKEGKRKLHSSETLRRSPEKAHFGATEETFLCLVLACSADGGGAESCNMKSMNSPENPPVEPVL